MKVHICCKLILSDIDTNLQPAAIVVAENSFWNGSTRAVVVIRFCLLSWLFGAFSEFDLTEYIQLDKSEHSLLNRNPAAHDFSSNYFW